MNTPWLKSLIFWIILIVIVFAAFQCTQKSENSKQASALMYERLYQCTRELSPQQQPVLKSIQQQLNAEMSQQELMKLINECRKAQPLKNKENYVNSIKSLK